MKRFIYAMLLLSLAGAGLSLLMLVDHFYPDTHARFFTCGGGLVDSCFAVSQSAYSSLLGIPIASLGLFFYLLIAFSILVADYAGGRYPGFCAALLVPFTGAGLAADAALGAILVYLRRPCAACMATYCITLALFILSLLMFRRLRQSTGEGLMSTLVSIFSIREDESDRRAVSSLFVLFAVFMLFSILAAAVVLRQKTSEPGPPPQQVRAFIDDLYARPAEKLSLPQSVLAIGADDAPVRIVVFTDFLCGACRKFFQLERLLLARYGRRLAIIHYNFPLESSCNRSMRETRYAGSCLAARAFLAAGRMGLFEEYCIRHFSRGKPTAKGFDRDDAARGAEGLADTARFFRELDSPATAEALARDIDIAQRLRIEATPTIFINGRRIEGVPPGEFLFAVIGRELENR